MTYKENVSTDMKSGVATALPPLESITEIAQNALCIASDIRLMSGRLHRHLFGDSQESCEKESEPSCLQETMLKTRSTLAETAELLACIMSKVGL